jgi:DNA-directed RNA polymerase subunit RPC12/RpoP
MRHDAEHRDFIVCPECGHEERDAWEYGESGDIVCPNCGQRLHFERNVTVTYTTTVAGGEGGK